MCVLSVCERAVSNLNPHFRWWYTLTLCRTHSLSHLILISIKYNRYALNAWIQQIKIVNVCWHHQLWCCETQQKSKEYSIKIVVSNWAVRTNATVVQCSSCVGYFSSTFYLNPYFFPVKHVEHVTFRHAFLEFFCDFCLKIIVTLQKFFDIKIIHQSELKKHKAKCHILMIMKTVCFTERIYANTLENKLFELIIRILITFFLGTNEIFFIPNFTLTDWRRIHTQTLTRKDTELICF